MKFLHVFLLSLALLIIMFTTSQPQQRVSPYSPLFLKLRSFLYQ
jgi:hypothetical protein